MSLNREYSILCDVTYSLARENFISGTCSACIGSQPLTWVRLFNKSHVKFIIHGMKAIVGNILIPKAKKAF